jgi:hypothetical protein
MVLYSKHYIFDKGEVYQQRDFIVQYTSSDGIIDAERAIDAIMEKVFNGCHIFFDASRIECDDCDMASGRWRIIDDMHPQRKYPKTTAWGLFDGISVSPIDWEVNKSKGGENV